MYSAFGLYLSAVGIALVFATLLAIGLLIEVTKRFLGDGDGPTEMDERLAKVAAAAAVMTLIEGEGIYQASKAEGTGHWRAAAKNEALERGMKQER